jgi:hypothetical protein
MSAKVISIAKGSRPNKLTHSVVDTILITPQVLKSWSSPPFQRPLRVNAKVMALAEQIHQDGGIIPGHVTLGVVNNVTYLVDGQHRREAWYQSGCEEGAADITIYHLDTMGDLGRLFVELNSRLVSMRPDDVLRGLEGTTPALHKIRTKCPFIGYDQIRRGTTSPMLSMATALRSWFGSVPEVPTGGGLSAMQMAEQINADDADRLIDGLLVFNRAWGRDLEYARLWNNLNLCVTMWLYKRTVLGAYSPNTTRLDSDLFAKCCMEVSADRTYLDWLHGRMLHDSDRAPCYNRIKTIYARRIIAETGKKPRLPSPAWAH